MNGEGSPDSELAMEESTPLHPVFAIKEVRQMILREVVQDDSGEVVYDQVGKCRLVCHDWLEDITAILRNLKEPLQFHLNLDKDHDLKGTEYYCKKEMKLDLEKIVTTPFPQIGIKVDETYLRSTKGKRFGQQLGTVAEHLVSLEAHVKPESSHLISPTEINFPFLQRFTLVFTKNSWIPVSLLLQPLLDKCPQLQALELQTGLGVTGFLDAGVVPPDFDRIRLPSTLTRLGLMLQLENRHLEVLAKSDLKNLKDLSFVVAQETLEDGAVFQVLENVRQSLESLFIEGQNHVTSSLAPKTNFRFPVMEKLAKLTMSSQHIELEEGVGALETYLPKLTELVLCCQNEAMISKWTTSNSSLVSVTTLCVKMTNDQVDFKHPNYNVNLTQHNILDFVRTFPNVKELEICFRHKNFDALKAVFREMTQLEKLIIILDHPYQTKGEADLWTCILLGINQQQLKTYRKSKNLTDLELQADEFASIKNLTGLKSLVLHKNYNCFRRDGTAKPLLSDLVFKLALLEMPALRSIKLERKSWASSQMTSLWKNSGRKIDYDIQPEAKI